MSTATLSVLLMLFAIGYGQKKRPVFSEEMSEIVVHLHNTCREKTGVAEQDILNCDNGIFKEDQKLKCYIFCLLEESGLVDENAEIDFDLMLSFIPDDYVDDVALMIDKCKHIKNADHCQKVFDMHKCSYETAPQSYYLT